MTETCELDFNSLSNVGRLVEDPDKCTVMNFLLPMLINDFKNDLSNCIFRGECPNFDTQMIIMTVCYAYCSLKWLILIMVCFYQDSRVRSIISNILIKDHKKPNDQNNNELESANQSQSNQHNQSKIEDNSNTNDNNNKNPENNNNNNDQNNQKVSTNMYELDQESFDVLQTYQKSIFLNIRVEIFMAVRDFFLFRGLGYFISYLYQVVFVYKDNGNFQCINSAMDNNCLKSDQIKFYLTTADICVIRFPFFHFEYDNDNDYEEQYGLMLTYIILWIISECLASSILFFNTQVLSYVNEGGKEQKDINNEIKCYSYIFFFVQLGVMCVLIFLFQIRLYFRFQSQEVLIFYLVWKSLGFMLLLDQYIKKKFLSTQLFIDIAYDKEMDWVKNENNNYKKAIEKYQDSTGLDNEVISDSSKLRMSQQNKKMENQYVQCMKSIHEKLKTSCDKKNQQQDSKIRFQWDSYLFFVLFTLFLGIVGLSLCLIHYSINEKSATNAPENTPENPFKNIDPKTLNTDSFQFGKYLNYQWIYWLGFVLCMLESAIFEIFNSVLLLHSYYLQLFKQVAGQNTGDQSFQQSTNSSHLQPDNNPNQQLDNNNNNIENIENHNNNNNNN